MFLQTTLLALPILGVVASAANVNLTALFGPYLSPGAQIILPYSANYSQEITQRWTIWEEPTYIGAIKPASEADVQKIVSQHRQGEDSDRDRSKRGQERRGAHCASLELLLNESIRLKLLRRTKSPSSQLERAMVSRLSLEM